MIIDQLNLNNLRIFDSVFRTRSMTLAAQELHLTQSGVSQHIRELEDVLGVRLFDRIKKRLVPTATANTLFKNCSQSLNTIEQTLVSLKEVAIQLSGTVNIGMPMEFGNNVILPSLALFCKMHPGIKFDIRYGFATQIIDDLLKGDLDFAFVDGFGQHQNVTTHAVYDEILILCASPELMKQYPDTITEDLKFFESLSYVSYQNGEQILRMWFTHHFQVKRIHLNIRATVMNAQGVAHIIQHGLAAGVLPSHLITKLKKDGAQFHEFTGSHSPLKNSISVAYLKERSHSAAAKTTLKWLLRNGHL